MAHAAGAGREDGEVGAPLPLQAKLVRLEPFADLVGRDRGAVGRAHLRALPLGVYLLLPPGLQFVGRPGVVAVATDDHRTFLIVTHPCSAAPPRRGDPCPAPSWRPGAGSGAGTASRTEGPAPGPGRCR